MQATHIDLVFPVRGERLSRDHGYALYGALSRAMPSVHGADWLGVHSIPGKLKGVDVIDLEGESRLRLRVPVARVADVLGLSGCALEVGGSKLVVGAPTIHQLRPAAVLDARLVVIRVTGGAGKPFDRDGFAQRFLAEASRQLARLEVSGTIDLRGRGRIRVGGQRVIGYAVRIADVSPDDSVRLQIHGLGGKRRMGCGLFRPARWKQALALEPAA